MKFTEWVIQVTYESAWSKNPPSGFIIFQLDLVQDSARHNHIACCLPQTLYRWAENRCESLSDRPTGNCEADPQQDHDLAMDGHCKFQAFPTRTVVPLPKNSLPKLVCLHCKSSYIILVLVSQNTSSCRATHSWQEHLGFDPRNANILVLRSST